MLFVYFVIINLLYLLIAAGTLILPKLIRARVSSTPVSSTAWTSCWEWRCDHMTQTSGFVENIVHEKLTSFITEETCKNVLPMSP